MSNAFLKGIDVSHFQGQIDWPTVAQQGIAFAYAKASEGGSVTDPLFSTNYPAMRAAGIARGAYHFLHADVDAGQQARHFLSVLGPPQPGDLPPMLDVETACGMQCAAIDRAALAWLGQVQQALGCTPLIYSSLSFWNSNLAGSAALCAYPLWIAEYSSAAAPVLPHGVHGYAIWQHAQTGKVDGIEGAVDLDLFNGTAQALAQLGRPVS
ncbi:glycoside hydrolase family 25 protein [Massilia aquatica]|uniref:Glycosyl hydrolase family 25 n=1 Tax=Massilia aquatica TaxID=2609000 RepID=A0ABX0LZC1_9BURK|nr:GH25 family lysozyme [Massilia aquatica]NHZ40228.1 glycosyl hydrolase family 25 [Massilia aquatica]